LYALATVTAAIYTWAIVRSCTCSFTWAGAAYVVYTVTACSKIALIATQRCAIHTLTLEASAARAAVSAILARSCARGTGTGIVYALTAIGLCAIRTKAIQRIARNTSTVGTSATGVTLRSIGARLIAWIGYTLTLYAITSLSAITVVLARAYTGRAVTGGVV